MAKTLAEKVLEAGVAVPKPPATSSSKSGK